MKKRNELIQSYRGILAFVVFLGHTCHCYNNAFSDFLYNTPLYIIFDGQAAVMCFFVLSGFFMKCEEWHIATYSRKITQRLIRLLPAYILTTIAAFAVYKLTVSIGNCPWLSGWGNNLWNYDFETTDLIRNLCFLSAREHTWMNPAAWYMQMDMKMMLVMPFLLGLACRYSKWLLILAIPLSFVNHLSPIIAVTTGFCVSELLKRLSIRLTRWHIGLFIIVGITCLDIKNIWPDYNPDIKLYAHTVGAGLLLFGILKADFQILKNKYLVWFGNYSYEFYLIHMIVMLGLRGLGISHIPFIVLVFGITLLCSVVLQRLCTKISNSVLKVYNQMYP